MPELEQLQAGHAAAVLAFELVNRAYFAAWVSDRGEESFDQFRPAALCPLHCARCIVPAALCPLHCVRSAKA